MKNHVTATGMLGSPMYQRTAVAILPRIANSSWCCLLLLLGLWSCPTLAQDETSTEQAPVIETAPVFLDGKLLFRLRGTSTYPAAKRAKAVHNRIRALAADSSINPDKLYLDDGSYSTRIMNGNQALLILFDDDAAIENISRRQLLASTCLNSIRQAIVQYRAERTPRQLLYKSGYTLLASLLLWLLVYIIRRGFRILEVRVKRHYQHRVKDIQIQSFSVVQAEQIIQIASTLLHSLRALLLMALTLLYCDLVLSIFPWTRLLSLSLFNGLVTPLNSIMMGIIGALPNIVFLIVLFIIVRWLLKMAVLFFRSVERGLVRWKGFESEWAMPTYRIFRMSVIIFSLVLAYPYIPGSGSNAFKGISIFMAVLASIGSPAIIANILAGYTITYRRAFKLGDRIQVGELMGDVMEMRLMVTHLRTIKNEELIIPNSVLINSNVINFSSMVTKGGLMLSTGVGIGYEVPWRQVEAMLLMAAERTPGLLDTPKPFVLQPSLGDYAVNYSLNVFTGSPLMMNRIYSDLHRNIQDIFNEYQVQIMTPSYMTDTPDAKLVRKEDWYRAPAKPPEDETEVPASTADATEDKPASS